MRHAWPLIIVFSLAAQLLGCGDKSSVALSARIDEVDLRVEPGTLGAELVGDFHLVLFVGGRAEGASTVEAEGFSLGGVPGLSLVLSLDPSEPFPLSVAPGQERTVVMSVADQDLLSADEQESVCAGGVVIQGLLRDSLLGGQTLTVTSSDIDPECP